MEFLQGEENKDVRGRVELLLETFDTHFAELTDEEILQEARRNVAGADTAGAVACLKQLLVDNAPCCAVLLKELVEKSKDDPLVHLEYLSLQRQVVMSVESFNSARNIAETALSLAKSLYLTRTNNQTLDDGGSPIYRAYFRACIDCYTVCRYQGQIKEATEFLEEARTAAKNQGNKEDGYVVDICHADLLYLKGQLNTAINDVLEPLKDKTMSDETKGLLLHKLGYCCRSAAQWGTAKQYLRESIRLAQKTGDKIVEHDRITDLGNVFRSEGRIADALEYQSRHMTYSFGRGDLWGLTVACFNVGFSYYSITPKPDLERAMIFLSLKYTLAARTHNEILRGMALNNLGKTFVALGQHEIAIQILKECTKVARATGNFPGEGMALGNIGTAYRTLGRYDEAVVYHEKYVQNAIGRGDDGGVAIMQREMSLDYLLMGDLVNAEKQAKDAILTWESIRTVLGAEDTSRIAHFEKNQAEAYNILQVILIRQGKVEEALELSEFARGRAVTDIVRQRSLKEFHESDNEPWLWNDLNLIKERIQSTDEVRADFFTSTADLLSTTFLVYSVVTDRPPDKPPEKWLYVWVVKCKDDLQEAEEKRISFRKVFLGDHKFQNKLLDDERFFTSLFRSFSNNSSALSAHPLQPFKKPQDPPPPAAEEEIEDYTEVLINYPPKPEVKAFVALLERLNLAGSGIKDVVKKPITQDTGTRDATLASVKSIEAEEKDTEDLTERTRQHMERVKLRSTWEREGFEQLCTLYDICISPIEDLLPPTDGSRVPKLTIIPHEFLFHVPFCALRDDRGRYFVERYVLSYTPSLRTLRLLHLRLDYLRHLQGTRKLQVMALGDPKMAFPDIPEISYSGKEAKLVQSVFGGNNCLLSTREEAKKSTVLENLGRKDVIHLATHAFPDDPEGETASKDGDYLMRGCIILAPSDSDCNGLLLAREIEKTPCTCQLITLSCCDTGLGKLTGDGVVGLYRAFFAAGVPGVVVTLWKIRDDITPLFMEKFYQLFQEKEEAATAVREAMLSLIKRKYPPSQWGAFSFIGASTLRYIS